jgi:RNA polymerase sigma-70 factor (ECF subfamily)
MVSASSNAPLVEPQLLDAARAGDERAYRQLVEPYRQALHNHCYRMLGSVHDADDALQDALLRAWRGLPGYSGRGSLRAWLYKITTNACLVVAERRSRRALPVDYGPASDPHDSRWVAVEAGWVEPYPDGELASESGYAHPAARYDLRESVELAFVAAVQLLPATQRAVLILRDVLGFSAREAATSLDTSVASVTSALQRARRAMERRLPERSQQANLQALGDRHLRQLVDRYVDAWEQGDAGAILAMLAEDATFSMPPYATWYRGRAAIAEFLPLGPLGDRWRQLPIRANGQLAVGCYRWVDDERAYVAHSVDVLTLRSEPGGPGRPGRAGGPIGEITAFLDGSILPAFGLPARL